MLLAAAFKYTRADVPLWQKKSPTRRFTVYQKKDRFINIQNQISGQNIVQDAISAKRVASLI